MFVTSGKNGLIQGALHIYSPIVIGALFLNSMGKLLIISRIPQELPVYLRLRISSTTYKSTAITKSPCSL